jgi:hypothetical protein
VLGVAHRGATCRAGVRMDAGCARGLGAKPFFQASSAKGMQAVEEREGAVEDIGADLVGQRQFSKRDRIPSMSALLPGQYLCEPAPPTCLPRHG